MCTRDGGSVRGLGAGVYVYVRKYVYVRIYVCEMLRGVSMSLTYFIYKYIQMYYLIYKIYFIFVCKTLRGVSMCGDCSLRGPD